MIRDTAMEIVDLAAGRGIRAEVYVVESRQATANLVGQRVRTCETTHSLALGLRVISQGRLGFFRTTAAGSAEGILDAAVAASAIGEEVGFDFPGPSQGPPVPTFDQRTADLTLDQLAALGRRLASTIGHREPEAVVKGSLTAGQEQSLLMNTSGAIVENRKTRWSAQVMAERVAGDDVTMLWDALTGTAAPDDVDEIVAGIGDLLRRARTPGSLAPGRYPVIFSPRVAFALFLPLLLGADGRNVLRGVSPLGSRVGEAIIDPRITVVDDPTLPGRPGSQSHDGEGTPAQPTPVVERGVLRTFLYDLKTAWEAGVGPTGHGQRQPGAEPQIGTSNLIVEPGDRSLAGLMGDIRQGLYVDQLIGLGATNLLAGALSNPVGLGFRIENGEIAGRVKDLSVAGNAYTMLKDHLGGLSRESRWVPGFVSDMKMPYVRLEDVSVSSRG